MKTFVFEVVIKEGSDEYWEELEKNKDKGIKRVTKDLEYMLEASGFIHTEVKLKKFEFEEE